MMNLIWTNFYKKRTGANKAETARGKKETEAAELLRKSIGGGCNVERLI